MPCMPLGAKPYLLKFCVWNVVKRNAKIVTRMMASFHHTTTLLMRANQRMPTRLMSENKNIPPTAAPYPSGQLNTPDFVNREGA